MYRPVLVTPATSAPVTLAEAKKSARIDHDDDDDVVSSLIDAATAHLERLLSAAFVEQTWRQDYDEFPDDEDEHLRMSPTPVLSLTSIKYLDADGVEQTIAPENYALRVDTEGPYVRFLSDYSAPTVYSELPPLSVTYVAGYSAVPAPIKQAIIMLVCHWYENREAVLVGESVADLPMGVQALIGTFWTPYV